MTTTNQKTENVQVDELFDINLLTTNFNTQASFNAEFNRIFGTSELFENIQGQCIDDNNFLKIKFEQNVPQLDTIELENIEKKINGIVLSSWASETQTIDELDEIDDIDDIDELDDLDLDLLYELDSDTTINKEEFKELLQASGIRISDDLADKVFSFFDKDENERLDYNEVSQFIKYIEQRRLSNVKSRQQKVKNVVNIDSRYRKDYYNNISTSFDYNLPEPQLDVTNIRLGNVDIPMTQYNVSSKLKNNSFLIISNANTVKVESDISSHWRLKMQIGDISSDWLHGSVFEDYSYTSTDFSNANDFAGGKPLHDSFWHGPETSTKNVYDTSIVPIETVTFEVSNDSFDENNSNHPSDEPVKGTMLDHYADLDNDECGLGNPHKKRVLFPRSRLIPLEEQSITSYHQPPGNEYLGDPWGAFANESVLVPFYSPPGQLSSGAGGADGQIQWKIPYFSPESPGVFAKFSYNHPYKPTYPIKWGNLKPKLEFPIDLSLVDNVRATPETVVYSENHTIMEEAYNSLGKLSYRVHQHPNGSRNYHSNLSYDVSAASNSDKLYIIIGDISMIVPGAGVLHNNIPNNTYVVGVNYFYNYVRISQNTTNNINNNNNNNNNHVVSFTSNTLPEVTANDISYTECAQLIFPDPADVSFGHVPYTKYRDNSIETTNHTRTIRQTTTYVKEYTFQKLTFQKLHNAGIWNGQDGSGIIGDIIFNHPNDSQTPASEVLNNSTNPWYEESSNNATYASRKWLLHTEINYEDLVKNQNKPNRAINVWFPRGNPNRTDIDFENVKYYNGNTVQYPYDCSGIHEITSMTDITKEIHLYSYTYMRLSDGKEMYYPEFVPVRFAWLVKLPDGNYDEAWFNINRKERIVNDAISLATPGAVDGYGNFAAIKNPDHYLFLNYDKFHKTRKFGNKNNNSLNISGVSLSDIRFTIDRISKKCIFSTSESHKNINLMKTSNNKFLIRTGQSSLRTVTDDIGNQDNVTSQPSGKEYTEMVLLHNVARQPNITITNIPSKKISTIKFNVDIYGNEDNETNIQHKAGWVLGFRVSEYLL